MDQEPPAPNDHDPLAADNERQTREEQTPWGRGVFALAVGLTLGYAGIVAPLQDAANHVEVVSYFPKGVLLIPFALVVGIAYTFFGKQALRWFGPFEKPTLVGWLALAACLVMGVTLYAWFTIKLKSYGYVDSR